MSIDAPPAPHQTSTAAPTPKRPGAAPGWLRRSVALPGLVAMTAVIAAQVTLRGQGWVYEWFWAFFSFHFVGVFLGPLVAGLGAWEGARLTGAADLLTSSGGVRRALRSAWAGVLTWTAVAYLGGLAAVVVLVKAAGTPGGPDLVALSTLGPALAFIGMWAALGVAAGWRIGSKLAAPLVAVAAFAGILVLYIVNYDLVRVGGATSSLLGLAPRPELQLAQIAIYAGITAGALLLASRRRGLPAGDRLDRVGVLATAGAGVVAALVLAFPGPDFRTRPEPEVCTGRPPICLAGGYQSRSDEVRAVLAPYLEAAAEAGLPEPKRFVQDLDQAGENLVGWISSQVLLGDEELAYYALMYVYVSNDCDIIRDDRADEYYGALIFFFDRAGDVGVIDTTDVEVLNSGSPEEQAAYLQEAVTYLRSCG